MLIEKKKDVLKKALKGKVTPVKVVNKVELAEKKMPEMKPTLRLSESDIPELKNWSVGKTYTVTLEIEQTSMSQGSEWEYEEGEDSKKVRGTFKVISVKAV